MKTGTIVMIVCLALYVLLRILFGRNKDKATSGKSVYDDPDFDGLDGSGIIGHSIDELNRDLYKKE